MIFERVFVVFSKISKGNQYPLCKLQEAIRLPHATLEKSAKSMVICKRQSTSFLQLANSIAKGNLFTF